MAYARDKFDDWVDQSMYERRREVDRDAKPQPALTESEKLALLKRVKELIVLFATCCGLSPDKTMFAERTGHFQTANGLLLQSSPYNPTERLWTPWGEWVFPQYQPREKVSRFTDQLTLRVHTDVYFHSFGGSFGPVYAVQAIRGVPLPEAHQYASEERRRPSDVIAAEWKGFFGGA